MEGNCYVVMYLTGVISRGDHGHGRGNVRGRRIGMGVLSVQGPGRGCGDVAIGPCLAAKSRAPSGLSQAQAWRPEAAQSAISMACCALPKNLKKPSLRNQRSPCSPSERPHAEMTRFELQGPTLRSAPFFH